MFLPWIANCGRKPYLHASIILLSIAFTIQIVLSWPHWISIQLVEGLSFYAPAIFEGQFWRIFTSPLLHLNAIHFFSNLIVLAITGIVIEPVLGRRYFVSTLIAAAVASNAGLLVIGPETQIIGSSGAISGLIGLLFGLSVFVKNLYPSFVKPLAALLALYTISIGYFWEKASTETHLLGLLTGLIVSVIYIKNHSITETNRIHR
jgi:rhomboid protease GluP